MKIISCEQLVVVLCCFIASTSYLHVECFHYEVFRTQQPPLRNPNCHRQERIDRDSTSFSHFKKQTMLSSSSHPSLSCRLLPDLRALMSNYAAPVLRTTGHGSFRSAVVATAAATATTTAATGSAVSNMFSFFRTPSVRFLSSNDKNLSPLLFPQVTAGGADRGFLELTPLQKTLALTVYILAQARFLIYGLVSLYAFSRFLQSTLVKGGNSASKPHKVNLLSDETIMPRFPKWGEDIEGDRRTEKVNSNTNPTVQQQLCEEEVTLMDIGGQAEAKRDIAEIASMLKDFSSYEQSGVGARLPSGLLLTGPPGTGKTLLARALATQSTIKDGNTGRRSFSFYAVAGCEFVEMVAGRGPARVRQLFKEAAENAPSVIFIDEIDSVGRTRRPGSVNTEQENTLNQLLTCMDGMHSANRRRVGSRSDSDSSNTSNNNNNNKSATNSGNGNSDGEIDGNKKKSNGGGGPVFVVGATNRPELLDPALTRAGRFDRVVQCSLPSLADRLEILRIHTRNVATAANLDLERIARVAVGCSGADLSAIVNEASLIAFRRTYRGAEVGGVGRAGAVGRSGAVSNQDLQEAFRVFFANRGLSMPAISEMATTGSANALTNIKDWFGGSDKR